MLKLKDFTEERGTQVLTVLCTDAVLMDTGILLVRLSETEEICTSSKERRNHFSQVDTEWFKEQLSATTTTAKTIATPDHPLEVLTADVCPIIKIEDKEYILSFFRDITPPGWLIPGGCPRKLEEILNPRATAAREANEEIILGDKEGRIFSLPNSRAQLKAGLDAWRTVAKEIIPLQVEEISFPGATANKLVVEWQGERSETAGRFSVDPYIGSLTLTLYWRINVPVPLDQLRIWDGERLPDRPLNRSGRLTDRNGRTVAVFSNGFNILSHPWNTMETEKRATAPFALA